MKIKNIVFDMGNVLLWWDPMLPCLRVTGNDPEKARKLCNATFLCPDWPMMLDSGKMTEDEFFALVAEQMDDPELKALLPELQRTYPLDSLYPVHQTERLVEELLEAGYPLYLLSNVGFRFHEYSYKIRGLSRFSGVVLSAEEKMMKPDLRLYQTLTERYHLEPGETLFVDDVPANIQGARESGWQGFCYDTADVRGLRELLKLNGCPSRG